MVENRTWWFLLINRLWAGTCVYMRSFRRHPAWVWFEQKPDTLQLRRISVRLRHSFDIILPTEQAVQDTVQLAWLKQSSHNSHVSRGLVMVQRIRCFQVHDYEATHCQLPTLRQDYRLGYDQPLSAFLFGALQDDRPGAMGFGVLSNSGCRNGYGYGYGHGKTERRCV